MTGTSETLIIGNFVGDIVSPVLRSRTISRADVNLCASWLQTDLVTPNASESSVAGALDRLIREERIQGAIFEKLEGDGGEWHAQAVGISGFVHPEIIDAHLDRPEPFLIQKVMRLAIGNEPRHFMDTDDQADANANSETGMDLVAHWMQRSWDIDDPLWRSIYLMAHESFIKEHRGFRINRMFHEDWARPVDIYLALGHRLHSKFEIKDHDSARMLFCTDRKEVLSRAPGLASSYLYQYADPICGFTRAEQRLLRWASKGLTDRQIADELDLSHNTLKSLWRSIFGRVQRYALHVFSELSLYDDDTSVRGTEKRRSVLKFVDAHPQELRPYRRT